MSFFKLNQVFAFVVVSLACAGGAMAAQMPKCESSASTAIHVQYAEKFRQIESIQCRSAVSKRGNNYKICEMTATLNHGGRGDFVVTQSESCDEVLSVIKRN